MIAIVCKSLISFGLSRAAKGLACGSLAAHLPLPVEATLRAFTVLVSAACTAAIALVFGCETAPEPATKSAVAQPHPRAPTPEERVAKFLLDSRERWDAAGSECYAAERCADVETAPHNGSVGSESEVLGCLESRITRCRDAAGALASVAAPAEIAGMWSGALRRRVSLKLELATEIVAMWRAQPRHPKLLRPGKDFGSAVDWGVKNEPRFAEYFQRMTAEDSALLERHRALDAWASEHALCAPGVACTFERVMAGPPSLSRALWHLVKR